MPRPPLSTDKTGAGGRTRCAPPTARLFDGDSGVWHVARGTNSKYYNSTRCSLQTAFPAAQPRPFTSHSASLCVRTHATYRQHPGDAGECFNTLRRRPDGVAKEGGAALKGFLWNNRRAADLVGLHLASRGAGCLQLTQSFQKEQQRRPTPGAVQMGSCVEK